MHSRLHPNRLKSAVTAGVAVLALLQTGCDLLARPNSGIPLPVPELVAEIQDARIDEASGLAASHLQPDRIWLIDDGGNPANLYAVGLDGEVQGQFEIDNTVNMDWEDLASFRIDGVSYLLIADIGNNHGRDRPTHLYLLIEPEIPASQDGDLHRVEVLHTMHFTYPDRARDAEAMAVDPVRREILILSKRETNPVLYRLPLLLEPGRTEHVAERLGRMEALPSVSLTQMLSRPIQGLIAGMPTAMDISADGRKALILTYNNLLLLNRGEDEDWASAISRQPVKIAEHTLTMAEGAGFSADGSSILFTSELVPAPIWRLVLP